MTWKEPPPRDYSKRPIRTPARAIREKCLDCSCRVRAEVSECRITSCPLWPFRGGKSPFRKAASPAARAAARRNIVAAQSKKRADSKNSRP